MSQVKAKVEAELADIKKLIADKFEDLKKGRATEAEFKTFTEKADAQFEAIEAKLNRSPVIDTKIVNDGLTPEVKAFLGLCRGGYDPLTPEEKALVRPTEIKAMGTTEDPSVGYLMARELATTIRGKLTEFSPIRQLATVQTIGVGELSEPKEGTDTVTAAWSDETLTAGDVKFDMDKFIPHDLDALLTPHRNALMDSNYNLDQWITQQVSKKFAVKEGTAFVSGASTVQPEGLLTNADIAATNSGDANLLLANGIIALKYALPDFYASRGTWIMRRSTVKAIRILVDGASRYLWGPSLIEKSPETLLGDPIIECPDMPAVAANAYPIIYGDFKAGYKIVDREGITMQRLVEAYAVQKLVGLLFTSRLDGQVVLAEALVKQKVSA